MSTINLVSLSRRERRKRGWRSRKVAALVLAGLVLASGSPIGDAVMNTAPSASAVQETGVGLTIGDVYVGSLRHSDGTVVYCAEYMIDPNNGTDPTLTNVTSIPSYERGNYWQNGQTFNDISVPAMSGDQLKVMNWIIGNYGQTANNQQAASVQMAIWIMRTAGASSGYQAGVNMMRNANPAVAAQADGYISEAQAAIAAGGTPVAQPGSPVITTAGPYAGSIALEAGTTSITAENAIFPESGTNTLTFSGGLDQAQSFQFIGQAPYSENSWDRYYTITFNGTYQYTVEEEGSTRTARSGGNGQLIITSTPPSTRTETGEFEAIYVDPDTIWSPTLTTEVPSVFVQEGESFSDTITFGVAEDSNPWRQAVTSAGDMKYAPIHAKGTLYGPFLADPADNPSHLPPNNAPVAAQAEVTTDADQGPGTYEVTSEETSREAGYYSWVWNIEYADQLESVREPGSGHASIPSEYFFTDGFGQVTEGQITPSDISFTTQVSDDQVVIGDSFTDDIHVTLNKGGWLQTDGARTEFTLRGTVYGSDQKPKQQEEVPADAEVIAESFTTINGPDETYTSDAIEIPIDTTANFGTIVWCLLDDDQEPNAAGKAKEYCDDYGVPSESFEILGPEVTTQAQEVGAVKGDIKDTAFVEGGVPNTDNYLTEVDFTAYLKPVAGEPKYDENWEVILDENDEPVLWTEEEVVNPEAVCDAQPVGTTDRVTVDGTGQFESDTIRAETEGTVYWMERLYITPTDPEGEEILYHTGKCGLPNETTYVEKPKVTTKAVDKAFPGDEIWDTAIVDGPLSSREEISYEVTFEAYHRAEGTTTKVDESLCTVDTKVWESTEATPVATEGEYKSEKWKVSKKHIGEILWVETLVMIEETDEGEERSELHRGECGIANEITTVKKETPITPVEKKVEEALAVTGGAPALAAWAAALTLLAAGGALFAARLVTKRREASLAEVTTE